LVLEDNTVPTRGDLATLPGTCVARTMSDVMFTDAGSQLMQYTQ